MAQVEKKKDYSAIEEFVAGLAQHSKIRNSPARSWWSKYIYHFTNINNIIYILSDGKLLSRNELIRLNKPHDNCTSEEIISNSSARVKKYVRLYFRPNTPTLYRSEGIRPVEDRWHGTHCSTPVYLLFDASKILTQSNVRYSDGNLAATEAKTYISAGALKRFPFEKIYHDTPLTSTDDKRNIIFHRNAEILVQNSIDLTNLKVILCRSSAEKHTLINCLPQDVRNSWKNKIYYDSKGYLFFRKWTYVKDVNMTSTNVTVYYNPETVIQRNNIKIEKTNSAGTILHCWEFPNFAASGRHNLTFPPATENYIINITIDGCLAFKGKYEDAIPLV